MRSNNNLAVYEAFHVMLWFFMTYLLKDQRDRPFLTQIALTTFVLLPFSAATYFWSHQISYFVWLYWGLVIFLLGPHLLMLHNICHRSPWKRMCKKPMDAYVSLLGLLFGLPPMIYYHHHIKMHHVEGNGPNDLSSTEKFKRDSFAQWLIYFFDFAFLNPIKLPLYFIKKKRLDYALKVLSGYILFFSVMATAFYFNPHGAVYVFVVPTLICWFGLMAGNWTQHAFIDPNDPQNSFKNSITVVDSLYNKRCFNDGYHIAHHFSPGMHWSEMPDEFEKRKRHYGENEALVFRTLDYQMIWFLLMLKQYKTLARYYVQHDGHELTLGELVGRIKERLTPLKC